MTDTVYLDTETTGVNNKHDEILQIAIVDDNGETLLDTFVKPVKHTSWNEAAAINGITPDMVDDAPTLEEITPLIIAAVKGKTVVIYNKAFDEGFIVPQLAHAASVKCAMLPFAKEYGEWNALKHGWKWQSLTKAAAHIGYQWEGNAHEAVADCLATRAVWYWLKNKEPASAL